MSDRAHRDEPARRDPGGPLFWIAAAVGLGLVAFGVAGLLRDVDGPALASWIALLAGALLAHDALLAPALALLSLLLVRLLPAWTRPPLYAGLIVAGTVCAIAIPLVLGDGRIATNPSLLPDDYDRNLLLVLGAIALATLAGLARARHAHRSRHHEEDR